jgi:hypothetical protein
MSAIWRKADFDHLRTNVRVWGKQISLKQRHMSLLILYPRELMTIALRRGASIDIERVGAPESGHVVGIKRCVP